MKEGRYFKTAEARRHTLADLIDRYLREVVPHKPKNASNTTLHLKWWKAKLGQLPARGRHRSSHRPAPQRAAGHARPAAARAMAPSTVVRYMAALSVALNVAVKDWEWLDDSPMRKVSKPREPKGRERWLNDNERAGAPRRLPRLEEQTPVHGGRAGTVDGHAQWRDAGPALGPGRPGARADPPAGHEERLIPVGPARRPGPAADAGARKGAPPRHPPRLPGNAKTDDPAQASRPEEALDHRRSTRPKLVRLPVPRPAPQRRFSYLAMNGASTIEIAADPWATKRWPWSSATAISRTRTRQRSCRP
jgi:hypothetical protein